MALPELAQGTQEEALPAVEPADMNVELPTIYGDDHVLVPECEYQEFLAPALRHHRSVVRKDLIPIERDPYPTRERNPTSFYSAKNVRRAYAVRLA